jgi:hypothetical protein
MRPDDLNMISNDAEIARAQKYHRRVRKQEEEQAALREAFVGREIGPEACGRVNSAVRRAAEQGSHQVQIITVPASYCNDGGRRINNSEPDWPNSLEGFAKKVYEIYERELKALGYRAHVEIIDYPSGMLGDVGMFLKR